MLMLCFGCKFKKEESTVNESLIKQTSISALEEVLSNKYYLFSEENPLDKYGQVYLIDFRLENNDTTITISKTYKPVIIDGFTDLEFKGSYYDEKNNPVIILDNKNPLGEKFYKTSMLNNEILQKFDSIEQPSNVLGKIKSKSYLIKRKKLTEQNN